MTRTLPLRVAPVPGEALDSWLEALAVRFTLTFGELIAVAGIEYSARPRWIVELSAPQLRALSHATDMHPTRLAAMTLSHFDEGALTVDHTAARIAPTFPWGAVRRSRYCPGCLADTGGRWQLSWRLNWSFACTIHHRLLVDTCPQCGDHQRTRPPSMTKIPRPGQCTARSHSGDCDGDLRAAEVVALEATHPAIIAQRRVHDVIEQRHARFGVFTEKPCSAASFLSDISILAARVLAHAKCSGLADAPAEDLVAAYIDQEAPRAASWSSRTYKPSKLPPSTAAQSAIGIAAAVRIVDCESIAGAASAMSWLVPPRGAGQKPTGFAGGLGGSPILTAIYVTAFAAELGPARQLRHRANLTVPGAARCRSLSPVTMARRLPTMLWPGWAVRIQPRGRHKSALRQSLSCAVLIAATSSTVRQAAELLGRTVDPITLTGNLGVLRADPSWAAISVAIARLAEYLSQHRAPIDYERRRRLDYHQVVIADDWRAMCERAGMPPRGPLAPEVACISLTAKISGLPPETALAGHPPSTLHTLMHRVRDLPLHLTPSLRQWLDQAGQHFLATHHVDEPLTWQPPLGLLNGLHLPNADIDGIDIGNVHDLAARAETSVGSIASTMGTDPDVIRHLLDEHPLGAPRHEATESETMPPWTKKARLRRNLPKERLAYLHDVEGKSGFAIAREVGVSYRVLRRLANGYGISFSRHLERPTPEWLHEHYVVKRRTQVDIATELSVHPLTVAGWIHDDDTTSRPTRVSKPTARPSSVEARNLLAPALARRAGRHSLQNFAAALAHPTIAAAADVLEMDRSTLWFQISQLEKDFGGRLLHKSRMPSLAMAPTVLGSEVAAAVDTLLREVDGPTRDEELPEDATHSPGHGRISGGILDHQFARRDAKHVSEVEQPLEEKTALPRLHINEHVAGDP